MNKLGILAVLLTVIFSSSHGGDLPYVVPVVVVKYFPVKGDSIDIKVTGDWGRGFLFTRNKVDSLSRELAKVLSEASRYHAYKNSSAQPSVKYTVIKTVEYLEPLPTVKDFSLREPMTDYNAIMERIGGKGWVESSGVKEIWLWGYHGGKVGLWESNMAGPYGDVSNSSRDKDDLPVTSTTFTFFHYNYQRGLSEAVEDHMHQIEALLNFVDGRDTTDESEWNKLLFWGKFVGSDKSHKIIRPGCGWAHYPPNGEKDYDWANPRYVDSDIEDWKPDGSGVKQRMNCEQWQGKSINWFVYWMQSLPGAENMLMYQGKKLVNWWIFVGDFDTAMKSRMRLVQ